MRTSLPAILEKRSAHCSDMQSPPKLHSSCDAIRILSRRRRYKRNQPPQETPMRTHYRFPFRSFGILLRSALAAALLAACAPAPLYKLDASAATTAPAAVAATPERYTGQEVVWGGRIVGVHNFADHSEIELLG